MHNETCSLQNPAKRKRTKAKRHTILAMTVVEPATAGDFEAIKALVRENECLMAVGKEEGNEDLLQMYMVLSFLVPFWKLWPRKNSRSRWFGGQPQSGLGTAITSCDNSNGRPLLVTLSVLSNVNPIFS